MATRIVRMVFILLVGISIPAYGQQAGCTQQQHCDQLDSDNGWNPGTCMALVNSGQLKFDYFEYNVVHYTIGDVVEADSGPFDVVIVDGPYCFSDWWCGDVPGPATVTYTWTRQIKTCYHAEGNVDLDVGTSLITKLVVKLGVTIHVGIGWDHCETTTDQFASTYEIPPCDNRRFWKVKGTAVVSGHARVVASTAHWHATHNGNVWTSECGVDENATGNADTVRYIHLRTQLEECHPADGYPCACIGNP